MLYPFFSKKSSSVHAINLDNKLSKLMKYFYFKLNKWNNRKPLDFLDSRIRISYFSTIKTELDKVSKRSPSRFMSDLFWKQMDWITLKKELGSINLLDLGCGKGDYLKYWNACSHSQIDSYIGFDINRREEWKSLSEKYTFATFKENAATSFEIKDLEKTNVLFSQSVFKHIENDLEFFKLLANYLKNRVNPFIQIHLIPAPSGLKNWQLHGVRQYTPRTISKITTLFPNSTIDLIAMGGPKSNEVHFNYITSPINEKAIDFRETKTEEFEAKVIDAIHLDLHQKNVEDPSFYALIIQHNCDLPISKQFNSSNISKKINSISDVINLNSKSLVLDLGANVGKITQQMADFGATVYAFEPNPFAFAKLKDRFQDNPKVICLNNAVLDKVTSIPLYFHENSDQDEITWSVGSSLLDFKNNVLKEKKVNVETVDMVAFIKEINKPIDLIKMDIEGVECKVINHLIDSKMMDSIKLMLVETHDHKIPELKEETNALRKRIKDLGLDEKINLNWI